ncbi:hypothetical protein DFJ74DRAFT_629131 [Hyaloraphidium curvatum]|nr:hypothetical protein DFJ74DRAFT_629131 [Hyaloraphidium curvatum]
MDGLMSNVPSLLGGILTSRAATLGVGGLLGAAYIDARLGISQDVRTVVRGAKVAKMLEAIAKSGRWNPSYRWSESVAQWPDRPAFRTPAIEEGDPGRTWTYAEADAAIDKYAKYLKEEVGVKFGDRVGLVFENTVQYLMLLLAIQKLGAIHAPQNFSLRGNGFIHCVSIVSASAVIFEDKFSVIFDDEVVSALKSKNVRLYCFDFSGGRSKVGVPVDGTFSEAELERRYPGRVEPPNEEEGRKLTQADSTCQILYTSGTTGLPKGARHQAFYLDRICYSFAEIFQCFNTPEEVTICVLPLYHAQGLGSFYNTMTHGGCFIPVRKFSARRFWSDCVRLDVTAFIYLGEIIRYLMAVPPSPEEKRHKVRRIVGAGIRGDIFAQVKERFNLDRISEFYAASDGTAFTGFTWWGGQDGVGAVGQSGWLVEKLGATPVIVKYDPIKEELVRDPATGLCIKCKRGEIGEVIGQYDPSLPGQPHYWANPEAVEKKIYRDVLKKGDMWWRSGDLMMQDENGYYYFMDRIGDTFRWRGENVSTFEVGNAMTEFQPLQEANVYGVKVPGAEDGRAGMAMVTLRDEYKGADVEALMRELGRHTAKKLPRYAVPIFIRLADEMEITGTFKHRKVEYQKEGMDPSVIKERLFWMPPGRDEYVPFGKTEYASLSSLKGKL